MNQPIHIVMTPTRNEAWVIRAFLESTTRRADYVIMCDQFSTDGTREIVKNLSPAFPSREGEIVRRYNKAQLTYDKLHYYDPPAFYPWLFHDDGVEPHGNYVREMHSMRIPYPIDEHDMTHVQDFRVLHLGPAPLNRVRAKERFYMFVDWQVNHRPPYTMGRNYIGSNAYPAEQFALPKEWIYTTDKDGWSLWDNVELDEQHCWMDDYIYQRLNKFPMSTLAKLPIWTPEFMAYYHLSDPRPWYVRWVHRYLEATQAHRHNICVRAIDKILRKLIEK